MIGSNFKRDNLSLKLNHKPNKRISLDFSVRYSNTTINGGGANESKNEVSSADSRMKDVMIYTPFNFKDLSDGYDPELQLTTTVFMVLPLINHVKTVTNNRLLSLLAKTENHFVIPTH